MAKRFRVYFKGLTHGASIYCDRVVECYDGVLWFMLGDSVVATIDVDQVDRVMTGPICMDLAWPPVPVPA